ncbi:hypothetical protein NA56DRAFT_590425 [Hyaloscypha hepaticicola]|uniref:Chorismate synthase protein n=1 Tax=Hyaloscypha hepaticicola TaxID=2082293 RepID=A0A2J6QLQ4_9HELO|nr:hypothetical protein NA56DRAFT_590425 [Hyaloscypha hepaticicola]
MAITWGTIKSLLLFFGPILLPKALAYYRSLRAAPSIHGIPIRPIPPHVSRALLILTLTTISFLLFTLPPFSPTNIFTLTQSRLQISTDVLFTRLSTLRPLTPTDEILRSKISSLESRYLYFQHGPDVLTDCQFCNTEDPNSYLYYSLPSLLAPHLFNLCVLALVTSGLFTGKEAAIWRSTATLAAGALILIDVYFVWTYDYKDNARALRLEDIDCFFWKMRVWRGIGIAFIDGMLGWLLYLSSTNRAFLMPPSTAERVEASTRLLDVVRSKMSAMGILRNTINRDEELRARSQGYWVHEGRVMGELMQEREVVDGVRNALDGRINMATITADAETYAQSVVAPLQAAGMNGNI